MSAFAQLIGGCRSAIYGTPAGSVSDDAWALSARHGVCPLVGADDQPGRIAALRAVAQRQLAHASEIARIAHRFRDDIDFIALKGPALAVQLYGNPAARVSCDLDLLVRPNDVGRALSALRQLGYIGPALEPNAFRHHVRVQHELALRQPDSNVLLELQWAWAQHHYAVDRPIEECLAAAARVSLCGCVVNVLSPEDTVLYLSVHGAKHGWAQLSFCTDFTAAAVRLAPDWRAVEAAAARTGLRRALAVGAELSRSIFAADVPVRTDRVARTIAARILADWRAGADPRASLPAYARQRERAADRFKVLGRALITPSPSDVYWLELPDRWHALYYMVRPLRLALRGLRVESDRRSADPLTGNDLITEQSRAEAAALQQVAGRG
jgi:hypothetical protein